MELKNAIHERRSIRGFLPKTVSQDILREVLALGTRAISAVNCQPWEIAVITGDTLQELAEKNVEALRRGDEHNSPNHNMTGIYRPRQVGIGKALFAAMDIGREDKEKRTWWVERGYRFFDAPAMILISMDNSLDANRLFDLGCLTQNICLAAMEYGLGTCVAYQAADFHGILHDLLQLPEDKTPVVGIAIGYPDDTFPANGVISQREPLDEVTSWYGF